MSEPTRLMVDIETLGTEPGCAICSIGAVVFDTGGLGDRETWDVDIRSCQSLGMRIDAETLNWWLDQSATVRELRGGDELPQVLHEFAAFYGESGADEIWANAPSFDCEILADAYDRVDIAKPWDYWDERCYRTLKSLPGAVDIDRQGDHHDALDDAAHQARVASATLAGWDDE
jgi:DNA polymerase III epsilon subunit-like protein